MKKKIIAFSLIVLGALPIIGKIMLTVFQHQQIIIHNDFIIWLFKNYGVAVILSAFIIGVILMCTGFYMLKKENFRSKSDENEQNLNPGETIIHKQIGYVSIVTITNQRVFFYGFYIDNLRRSVPNIPLYNKMEYPIAEIKSVRAVSSSDLADRKMLISAKWGIQFELENGKIVNIPISGQDIVAQEIDKLIKQKPW